MKIDLTWVTVLLLILKLTGVIHISWFWVFLPVLLALFFMAIGVGIVALWSALVLSGKVPVKITYKGKQL